MKNLFLTSIFLLSALLSVNAQTFEGEITYKITYSDLPEEAEMYKAMLPSKSVVVMKNEKTMTEQKSMGIVNIKIISNTKTKKTVMLMDMMGKKIMMEDDMDSDEIKKSEFEVIKKSETKTIAGYKCNKAILKGKDGNEVVYWYTKSLPGYKGKSMPNIDIKGFPMEFEIKQEAMSMKMTVTTVDKKAVSNSVFDIPEGYEKMTKEDMQKMMKGMGGM
jgi:GLPGLI family protein